MGATCWGDASSRGLGEISEGERKVVTIMRPSVRENLCSRRTSQNVDSKHYALHEIFRPYYDIG